MPSDAIWAVLGEILESSYTSASPRFTWVYFIFPSLRNRSEAAMGETNAPFLVVSEVCCLAGTFLPQLFALSLKSWGVLTDAQTMQPNRAVNVYRIIQEQSLVYRGL